MKDQSLNNISPFEIENFALNLSLEFGKHFGRKINNRMELKFPKLTSEELENYQTLCEEIKTECWNCIEPNSTKINTAKLSEILNEKIFEKYSWINERNKRRLISQFSYYFWKDGILD